MALVVEFVGLPASGKTTLAGHLATQLQHHGCTVANHRVAPSLAKKLASKLCVVFGFWRALLPALGALVFDDRPARQRMRAVRWLISTLEGPIQSRRGTSNGNISITAEGVLQRALLLFFRPEGPVKERLLTRYLSAIPHPDLAVFLDVQPEEAARRHIERPSARHSSRFEMPHARLVCVMADAQRFLEGLIAAEVETHGVKVVRVKTDLLEPAFQCVSTDVVPVVLTLLESRGDKRSDKD